MSCVRPPGSEGVTLREHYLSNTPRGGRQAALLASITSATSNSATPTTRTSAPSQLRNPAAR
ncbi:MAG: hypothetical protein ACLGH0_13595, partial [Thermoanaerobaculia bacterium]